MPAARQWFTEPFPFPPPFYYSQAPHNPYLSVGGPGARVWVTMRGHGLWEPRGVLKLYSKNIEKFLDNRGRIHVRLHHEQYCRLSWIIMEISGNLWKAGSASEPCEKKHTWGNSVSQKASLELLLSCFSDTLPHRWYARWVISKSFNWPSILPNTAPKIYAFCLGLAQRVWVMSYGLLRTMGYGGMPFPAHRVGG